MDIIKCALQAGGIGKCWFLWGRKPENPEKNPRSSVDKTRIGPDQIGSDQTDKTSIGSNAIKETHIHSLKVDAFQIPIKDDKERSRTQ